MRAVCTIKLGYNEVEGRICSLQSGFFTTRCQFHQRFCVQIFRKNIVLAAFSNYVLALAKKIRTKNALKKC